MASSSSSSSNSGSKSNSSTPPVLLESQSVSANVLPGGTAHTANPNQPPSSRQSAQDYSLIDAAKTIKLSDYKTLHTKPCVRDALMTGIATGAGIGGIGAVMGRK